MTHLRPDNIEHAPDLPCALKDLVYNNRVDAMCVVKDLQILEANDSLAGMLSFDNREELIGMSCLDVIVPQQAHLAEDRTARRMAGESIDTSQIYTCAKKGGGDIQVEVSTIPWPSDTTIALIIARDVTQREKGIEALEESEKLYRTLAETIPAGVTLVDQAGKHIYVNEQAAELSGYTVEELMKGVLLTHPDEKEAQRIYADALEKGTSGRDLETRFLRKDGSTIWVSISWQPILDSDGKPLGIHSTFTDITERKHIETALRATKDLYQTISQTASDMIWQMDTSGTFTFVSPAVRRYGYEPEDMVGHSCLDFMADVSREQAMAVMAQDRQAPAPHQREIRMLCKDGGTAWIELSINFIMEDGRPIAIHGIARNIDERKEAEQALRESEAHYRAIVEDQIDLISRFRPDYTLTFVNDAYCRYFRTTSEEVVGKSICYQIPEEDHELVRTTLASLNPANPVVIYEHRVIGPDGDIRWHLWTDRALFDEQGNVSEYQAVGRDVTARRLAEEAVRESEKRYRGLVETHQDMIVRCTPDGILTFVNDAYCTLFGKSQEELLGSPYMLLVHEEDIPATLATVATLQYPPHRATMEQRDRTVHGWRWLSWEDCAIFDEEGRMVEIQAVGRDITERKEMEEALRESEEQYRTLVEQASDGIFIADAEGHYTDVNTSGCAILGRSREEILQMGIKDLIIESEIPVIEAQFDKMRAGETVVSDWLLKHKSGTMIPVEISAKILSDGRMQGIVRDITERKRVEEALRKSEENNRALLQAVPDLMFRNHIDGTFLDYKTSDEVPLYLPPEAFLGKKIVDVMPPEMARKWMQLNKLALKTGKTQLFEYALHIAGETHYFEDRVVQSGENEILSIIRDITARKNAEKALREAHDDLAKAYELQREFLNNVTHEVRTPLTAVQGYVQMLLEGTVGPVTDEQASLLRKVLASSEHLLEIVGSVLEIARLKSGRLLLRPTACQPGEIVEKAVAQILPQAARKGLKVNVSGTEVRRMDIYDEEKFTRILINLLSNAVKFTREGEVHVMLRCHRAGTEVIVADTGMGINQAELGSIFDEFRQLDFPQKHKPAGFGIGLAIVARMVETIGATLVVSSKSGVGTAFTLDVPSLKDW